MAALRAAVRVISVVPLPRPRVTAATSARVLPRVRRLGAVHKWAPGGHRGFCVTARQALSADTTHGALAENTDPHSFEGTRALAKLAMLVYWNAGQPGFWDPGWDGDGLDMKTPLGFEPLIARDPLLLRKEVFGLLAPKEPALWLCPGDGVGDLVPNFLTPEDAARRLGVAKSRHASGRTNTNSTGYQGPRDTTEYRGVSRAAVVRLEKPNWIVVCFRGTTPSPMRGLLREGQVNSMAGQETWQEAPGVMQDARVHRGYAAAYRSVLADVESAVVDWAVSSARDDAAAAPKIVIAGHSLGGALAVLCATRLAHDVDIAALIRSRAKRTDNTSREDDGHDLKNQETHASKQTEVVNCVTFGQPRVGDGCFKKGVDEGSDSFLRYTRIVRGGDLFARVPTSGVWLPSGNGDRFGLEYAHAGSMVWTNAADGANVVSQNKGEETPSGFNWDWRMANPAGVARDHAGYAYFFEDAETKSQWPSR